MTMPAPAHAVRSSRVANGRKLYDVDMLGIRSGGADRQVKLILDKVKVQLL